jgi:hypothetical protein
MTSSLRNLTKPPQRYATAFEIRARIGQPITPCPCCGQPVRAVLHTNELACPECSPGIDYRSRSVAILLVAGADGNSIELDRELNPIPSRGDSPAVKRPANLGLAPGFRIVAVASPLWPMDPDVAYAPDASQAERAAALEMFEWDSAVRSREADAAGRLDGRQGEDARSPRRSGPATGRTTRNRTKVAFAGALPNAKSPQTTGAQGG